MWSRIRIELGKSKALRVPIIAKKSWAWLPPWVCLHAERGRLPKCWEGHRLAKTSQDGPRGGCCVWCERKPRRGESIRKCPKGCDWVVCEACVGRQGGLPKLADDPLFHGPDDPCLLPSPVQVGPEARGTVIICPGGNYEFLVPQEGMPAASWLASCGFRAFVLRYRHLPSHNLRDALKDLEDAAWLVRRTYGGPVAAMGFSAGGHLVASLGLQTKSVKGGRRPLDAQVLVYPCIDGSDWTHSEWCGFFDWDRCYPAAACLVAGRKALMGGRGFAAPPTLMVASTADEASPPKEHTDIYARALRQKKVPFTYLRRNFGAHGFGLAGGWTGRCAEWLKKKGFQPAAPE